MSFILSSHLGKDDILDFDRVRANLRVACGAGCAINFEGNPQSPAQRRCLRGTDACLVEISLLARSTEGAHLNCLRKKEIARAHLSCIGKAPSMVPKMVRSRLLCHGGVVMFCSRAKYRGPSEFPQQFVSRPLLTQLPRNLPHSRSSPRASQQPHEFGAEAGEDPNVR